MGFASYETAWAWMQKLRRAMVRPDRELPVQKLIAVMDTLQRAQITKVGVATKAEAK